MTILFRKYSLILGYLFWAIFLTAQNIPKVSIITSVYKGKDFIVGFLEDLIRQTIFSECEFIIINANSPDPEDGIVQFYAEKYDNIIYIKLDHDPGLYAVWNMAINLATADLITNANVDDRLAQDSLEVHSKAFDNDSTLELIYSDFYLTPNPNMTFEQCKGCCHVMEKPIFSLENLKYNCLPGNHPMWRKSLHAKYGLFNINFRIAGDYEMWIRLALNHVKFKKIPGIYSAYYVNPRGLSTDHIKNLNLITHEFELIHELYPDYFDLEAIKAQLPNG